MANLPMLLTLSTILLVSTLPSSIVSASTVGKDQVPCTMCSECENPCQPLPPPPPPPVIECPPPPSPPPPPPPSPPPAIECPPPPKPICSPCETVPAPPRPPKPPCEDSTCLPSLVPPYLPEGTPINTFPVPPGPGLYPPATMFPSDDGDENDAGKMLPPLRFSNLFTLQYSFTFVALLCLPYYLFL